MTKIDKSSADEMNWKSVFHQFLLRGLDLLPSRELVIWDKYIPRFGKGTVWRLVRRR